MHPRSRSKAPSWWPASTGRSETSNTWKEARTKGSKPTGGSPPSSGSTQLRNAGASGKAVTFKPTDYTQYDHFNWGGIANPFLCAAEHSAVAAVGTDISGRMYTSQECTAATTDFSAAKFGDLAYWASTGKSGADAG